MEDQLPTLLNWGIRLTSYLQLLNKAGKSLNRSNISIDLAFAWSQTKEEKGTLTVTSHSHGISIPHYLNKELKTNNFIASLYAEGTEKQAWVGGGDWLLFCGTPEIKSQTCQENSLPLSHIPSQTKLFLSAKKIQGMMNPN